VVFHRRDALVGSLPDGYFPGVRGCADRCELTLELSIGTLNTAPVHLGIGLRGDGIVHSLLTGRLSALTAALQRLQARPKS